MERKESEASLYDDQEDCFGLLNNQRMIRESSSKELFVKVQLDKSKA